MDPAEDSEVALRSPDPASNPPCTRCTGDSSKPVLQFIRSAFGPRLEMVERQFAGRIRLIDAAEFAAEPGSRPHLFA
jgi:hypothetical protein